MIENVLASRYASAEMRDLWDPAAKVRLERRLWVTVLEEQMRLGLDVPEGTLDAYVKVVDQVDLESIRVRERRLLHDVKARIEEFNGLAGHESVHLGMTSRDLTENVELLQMRRSIDLILVRAVAALGLMARLAAEHSGLALTARTHNVPAQVTTVGKRFATAGEELAMAIEVLENVAARLPLRGIKGPVGTQQDQMELLGSPDAALALDRAVAESFGFDAVADSVGQVYPRSLDLAVISALVQLAAGPANLTNTLRLMAGHDLVSEGFRPDQVGSSAMPHKMNARTSERIHGFKVILDGHLTMASGLAGEQWSEGDVSCSVVRRVMLPDAFFAIDGLFQGFLVVLDELAFFPAMIERELAAHLPFLATTRLLGAAVHAGTGREAAHAAIKAASVAAALANRSGPHPGPGMIERLGADPEFPLDTGQIEELVADPLAFTGLASRQVDAFVTRVDGILARHRGAVDYRPDAIL